MSGSSDGAGVGAVAPTAGAAADASAQESNEIHEWTGDEPIETNNVRGEQTEYTNDETNETNNARGGGKRRRRRFEKPTEKIIDQVIDKVSKDASRGNARTQPEEVKLTSAVDVLIKMKLIEWDADQNGYFTKEEVVAAMDDLREAEEKVWKLKSHMIACFVILLIFVGVLVATVAIIMMVTQDVDVGESGDMIAPLKDTNQKVLVELTTAQESGGWESLLEYDNTTDQWLIADQQLVNFDTLTFRTQGGVFYHLDIAELVRIDTGSSGTNDKVLMYSTGGHQLRIQELDPRLEVQWWNSVSQSYSNWEFVDTADMGDGRRLKDAPADVLPSVGEDPPRRMYAKGGTMVYAGPMYGARSGGGGGSGCTTNGRCNVPAGAAHCKDHCRHNQCYDKHLAGGKVQTWKCDHNAGARELLTWSSRMLLLGLLSVAVCRS